MHLQVRFSPRLSPPDVAQALQTVKDAGLSLRGIGGSDVELPGGEVALAPSHDDAKALMDALVAYKPRLLDADDPESGLTLCIVEDRAGGLHDCLIETANLNAGKGRVIRDILVGVPDAEQQAAKQVPVQIFSESVGRQRAE
jgi:hypothetical protein